MLNGIVEVSCPGIKAKTSNKKVHLWPKEQEFALNKPEHGF